ncbi:transposase [Streptomyces sp. NPDC001381]|uniref:transposase n=1 Tax=Streptomyces sp. NPDC001381 TaxID=3364567 RepID=UPI0036AED2E9
MKHYPPQFKADAVALYESRPEATIRSVAADLGINPETLRNWVRAAGVSRPRGRRGQASAESPTLLEAENAALRKKVRELEEEREILRKAAPDACQILRGTAGNSGEPVDRPPRVWVPPPQVRPGASPRRPKLPKLRAQFTVRSARLALVDGMAAWLRPVGVQRGIRVRGRAARPPSWLAVVG